MRRIKKIKLLYSEKKGTSYRIEWGESENGTVWERHILESSDYPRPEFEEAVWNMAVFLVKACEINIPEEEIKRRVDITNIVIEQKDVKKVSISGNILLPNGYSIRLNGPQISYQPDGETFDKALIVLEKECFRYIDGNRAQMKLFKPDGAEE